METDHIVPTEDHGGDEIGNAIPVCFECHAEIHSYNDKHPRGRKFSADELRGHKEQWLKTCDERPEVFLAASRTEDVGPLQALIDELEFNSVVAQIGDVQNRGCRFREEQFLRAIHEGSISILRDEIRGVLLDAYREIGSANKLLEETIMQERGSHSWGGSVRELGTVNLSVLPKIQTARNALLKFLSNE